MARNAARPGSRRSRFSNTVAGTSNINPRTNNLVSAPDHGKGPAKDKRTRIARMVAAQEAPRPSESSAPRRK